MSNASYKDPAYEFESYSRNQERQARSTVWTLDLEEWLTLTVDEIKFNVFTKISFERQGERGEITVKTIEMTEIGELKEKHEHPFKLDREDLYVSHLLTYNRLENAVQLELMKMAITSKDWST